MKTIAATILLLLSLTGSAFCVEPKVFTRRTPKADYGEDIKKFMLKGLGKVTDAEFKKQLIKYILFEENDDFRNMYYLLSKKRINSYKKFNPNVVDAETYKNDMLSSCEVYYIKYLEVIDFNSISKSKCQVDVKYDCYSEEEYMWIKDRYYFVKEDGQWKYDGFDSKARASAVIIQ